MTGKLKINKLCFPEIVKLRNPFSERWANVLVFELFGVLGSVALTGGEKIKITIIWVDISAFFIYIFFYSVRGQKYLFRSWFKCNKSLANQFFIDFLDNNGPLTAKQVMTDN